MPLKQILNSEETKDNDAALCAVLAVANNSKEPIFGSYSNQWGIASISRATPLVA
jgi:hypothetical protein